MIKIIIFLLLYVPLESIAADDEEVKVSIAQYRGGRDAAISYTFDDGLLEQYTLVFPELEKRNIKDYIRCEWRLDGVVLVQRKYVCLGTSKGNGTSRT